MNSIFEIGNVLQIGQEIIDNIKKQYSNIDFDETYDGKFKDLILEYVNTFIIPDSKIENLDEASKTDLCIEIMFIECFCKWMDKEKNIVPIKK
jgi:hypothetical protein